MFPLKWSGCGSPPKSQSARLCLHLPRSGSSPLAEVRTTRRLTKPNRDAMPRRAAAPKPPKRKHLLRGQVPTPAGACPSQPVPAPPKLKGLWVGPVTPLSKRPIRARRSSLLSGRGINSGNGKAFTRLDKGQPGFIGSPSERERHFRQRGVLPGQSPIGTAAPMARNAGVL